MKEPSYNWIKDFMECNTCTNCIADGTCDLVCNMCSFNNKCDHDKCVDEMTIKILKRLYHKAILSKRLDKI